MAQHLTSDPAFAETSFLVIDFETTTPLGRRPEPIEVAALALRANGVRMAEVFRYGALIQPPEHASISNFDVRQTGITRQMVAGQPLAATVLAALDAHLTTPPYRLVAHHAPTEGGIVYDYRHCCPRLAATPLLETVLALLPRRRHLYGRDRLVCVGARLDLAAAHASRVRRRLQALPPQGRSGDAHPSRDLRCSRPRVCLANRRFGKDARGRRNRGARDDPGQLDRHRRADQQRVPPTP